MSIGLTFSPAHALQFFFFKAVFDYDEGLLESHDPIGRVVINLDRFEHDTVYTLKYPLFHGDTQEEDVRQFQSAKVA